MGNEALPIVPHMDWGDKECCGCLIVQVRGDRADITCNECGVVVRSVPVERASVAMSEMASGEICSARCTNCEALNTFSGLSAIEAFICSECGEGNVVTRAVQ